jgi:hypothetical protein
LGKISIKGNHKKLDIKKKIVSIVLMTWLV